MDMSMSYQLSVKAVPKQVSRSRQKVDIMPALRTTGGRLFLVHTAATGKVQSPRVEQQVDGTSSVDALAEQS